MKDLIEISWKNVLSEYLKSSPYQKLESYLKDQYEQQEIFPPYKDLFYSLKLSPIEQVKVIILGQDPYHGKGQAHGLAFSVPHGMSLPPSLKNIYKEIQNDTGIDKSSSGGDLSYLARQGVLLLNTVMSVQAHRAHSHAHKGWEEMTDKIIEKVSDSKEHLVFLLWGAQAQKKLPLIDQSKHLVLMSAHPSPLSAYRGFLGNKHFSQTNAYLRAHGKSPIKW